MNINALRKRDQEKLQMDSVQLLGHPEYPEMQRLKKHFDTYREGNYSGVKDLDKERPSRMVPTVKVTPAAHRAFNRNGAADFSFAEMWANVYADKYGAARTESAESGLISLGSRLYVAIQKIIDEKAQMLMDLGEELPKNYFAESFFSVWKRWLRRGSKPNGSTNPLSSEEIKEAAQELKGENQKETPSTKTDGLVTENPTTVALKKDGVPKETEKPSKEVNVVPPPNPNDLNKSQEDLAKEKKLIEQKGVIGDPANTAELNNPSKDEVANKKVVEVSKDISGVSLKDTGIKNDGDLSSETNKKLQSTGTPSGAKEGSKEPSVKSPSNPNALNPSQKSLAETGSGAHVDSKKIGQGEVKMDSLYKLVNVPHIGKLEINLEPTPDNEEEHILWFRTPMGKLAVAAKIEKKNLRQVKQALCGAIEGLNL